MLNGILSDDATVSRRQVLAGASAVTGSGLLLAACGSSGKKAAATTAPAAAGSTSSPERAAAAAPAVLATLASIPVGGAVSATGKDNAKLLVCQPTKGKVVAFSAICTHMGCTVAPADKSLNCPCHGSKYDVATGKVTAGPAPRPLPPVDVSLDGGNVVQA
jgi:cytochrome b6-f complex iron-sulfur subunit